MPTTKMTKRTRKPSWIYHDLAWKIKVKTPATKLVLTLLGKCANDFGKSYMSYEYIMLCCDIDSRSTVSNAIKQLRLMGVVIWKKGGKRGIAKDANEYKLDMNAMKRIVVSQGRFEVSGGRRKSAEPSPILDEPSPMVVKPSPIALKPSPITVHQLFDDQPSANQPSENQPSPTASKICAGEDADSFGDEALALGSEKSLAPAYAPHIHRKVVHTLPTLSSKGKQ